MRENRAGISGGNYFYSRQPGFAGYPAAYSTINSGWTDQQGLTPQGMSRLVIIALLLIGPYISLLFPVQGTAIISSSNQSTSAAPAPENKDSAVAAGLNSTAQAPAASAPVGGNCFFTGVTPLDGLAGNVYPYGSSSVFGANSGVTITVKVLDPNNNYNVLRSYNFNKGNYKFDNVSTTDGVPAGQELVIQFDATPPSGTPYATTYFDYFKMGTSNTTGRYTRTVATKVWFSSTDCTAYALVPNPLPAGYPVNSFETTTFLGLPSDVRAVTMTNGSVVGGARTFDAAMPIGRAIGGRVFSDNGTNDPPPYYNDGTGSIANVSIYTFNNGVLGAQPVGTANADGEGFYILAPITTSFAFLNGRYALKFGGNGILTSYYCNYAPNSGTPNVANIVPFDLDNTQPAGGFLLVQHPTDPRVTTNNPPCTNSNAVNGLATPGIHDVIRPNAIITGTIDVTSGTVDGAYAVAYQSISGTLKVAGTSDPVTSADHHYIIQGLLPNVTYYVRFFPPPSLDSSNPIEQVGAYWQNKPLDTPLANLDPVTITLPSGVKQDVNITLGKGSFFTGQVGFNGPAPTPPQVEVSVYRLADLNQVNPQPVDITQTDSLGHYTTHQILEPGQGYVLNFRPYGAASGYIASWCASYNSINNTCTVAAADASSAAIFTPTIYPGNNQVFDTFVANINVNLGVVLQGNITPVDNNGNPLGSNFPNGSNTAVYVYKVTNSGGVPTNLSLAQLFNVNLSGASVPYSTSALFTSTNYILKFVPTPPVNDPGFRAAYYSQTVLAGSVPITGASIIIQGAAGNFPGYNMGLMRAAGVTVTLLNYQGVPYPNVRVDIFGADQDISGVLPKPYYSGTTDNSGVAVISGIGTAPPSGNSFHIRFSPLGIRGGSWYTTTLPSPAPVNLTPGVFTAINFTMPPVAAAGGTIKLNSQDGTNWAGSLIQIYNSDLSLYGTFQSDHQGDVEVYDTSVDPNIQPPPVGQNDWAWQAFLPPGTYYFAVISPTTGTYVRHWYVSGAGNQADPNFAFPVTVSPNSPNTGLNVSFTPGGVARVYVTDPFSQPIAGAIVKFYSNSSNCNSDTSPVYFGFTAALPGPANALVGSIFSLPFTDTNNVLWYKAFAPGGSQVEDGSCANFNSAPFQTPPFAIGQTKYLTVTLPPTPIISGTVKKRGLLPNLNQEFPLQGIEVALVDNADNILSNGNAFTTTDSLGRYTMRLPQGFFKLRFRDLSVPGLGTRYWVNNPQQTGTLTNTLATTLQKIAGQNYINYNQIYDLSVPNSNSCRITDMYVLNTTVNSAQIQYFTNCLGTTQLGWNQGSPSPSNLTLGSYAPNITAQSDTGGVYTHTVTLSGLAADTNYYVRPFSTMPPSVVTTTATPADVELQVRTSSNGQTWYFASGNITTTATVSTTEVLHLFNYNSASTNVTITYVVLGQAPVVKNVSIPANGRKDINVNDPADPNSLAIAGAVYRTNHSTMVSANQSIMVEKTQTATGLLNGYPYNGGYTVPGATAPSINWWFPEISTAITKEQVLSIYNPSTTISACLQLNYKDGTVSGITKPDGQPGNPRYLIILPNSRKDITIATDAVYGPGVSNAEYGVFLSSFTGAGGYCGGKVGVIAELETHYVEPTFDFYHKGVAGIPGASGSSQRWYFLDGQSDKAYDVKYSILNTVNSPGVVTITASIDNPATGNIALTYQITRTLAANQRISYSLPYTLFNQSASGQRFGFTARVDASVAVVAQRSVRYLYSSTPAMDSLYQELGTTRASGRWLFAAGDTTIDPVTPKYTEESLNIYNSAPYSTSLTITYYFDTGAPMTFTNYVLGPYSRINLQPYATANLPGPNYPSVGTGKIIAVMIDSANSGVFAERLVYWRKGNINGGGAVYGWNPSGY